jgi:hypothetical protein
MLCAKQKRKIDSNSQNKKPIQTIICQFNAQLFAQAGIPTSVLFRLQKSFNLESKEMFQDKLLINFRGKH